MVEQTKQYAFIEEVWHRSFARQQRRWLVSKYKDKIISHFILSEYTRKHDTVSGNPNQRTLNRCNSFN